MTGYENRITGYNFVLGKTLLCDRSLCVVVLCLHTPPRVAKFKLKVGSRMTTKNKNLVILVIILVVLIWLPIYYMYVILVLILLFLLVRERQLERFVGMKMFGSILSQNIWFSGRQTVLNFWLSSLIRWLSRT